MTKCKLVIFFVLCYNYLLVSQSLFICDSLIDKLEQEVSKDSFDVNIKLKYFTSSDTISRRLSYKIEPNAESTLKFDYISSDINRDFIEYHKNNKYYKVNNIDSSVHIVDYTLFGDISFENNSMHFGLKEKVNFKNFLKTLESDKIKSYNISVDNLNGILTLNTIYLTKEVESHTQDFIFDMNTRKLIQFKSEVIWEDMIQYFEFNFLYNQPSVLKPFPKLNELLNQYKVEWLEKREEEKNDSLLPNKFYNSSFYQAEGDSIFISNEDSLAYILYFWYKDCYPCRKLSPIINDLFNDSEFKNIRIIGINPYDSEEEILKYFKKYKFNFPTICNDKSIVKFFKIHSFPNILFLDKSLKVHTRIEGFSDNASKKIRSILKEMNN